jgi:hypothetical protein
MQTISTTVLRRNLRHWCEWVRGNPLEVVEVTYHGQRIGLFMAMEKARGLSIYVSSDYTAVIFRDRMGGTRQRLSNGTLDAAFLCEWKTGPEYRVAALVNNSYADALGVPADFW